MVKRLVARQTLTVLSLTPATALACGACTDAFFASRLWWAGALPGVAVVLLLEELVWASVARSRLLQGAKASLIPVVVGGPAGIAAVCAGAGMTGGALVFVAALGVGLAWSVAASPRRTWWLQVGRVALLLVVAASIGWSRRPAALSTDRLVALEASVPGPPVPAEEPRWLMLELRRRPDAVPAVERALAEYRPTEPSRLLPGTREQRLLSLHLQLGAPPAPRREPCANYELSDSNAGRDSVARVRGLCATVEGAPGTTR